MDETTHITEDDYNLIGQFLQKNQRRRDKNISIQWAKSRLADPADYLIFDTETTGFKRNEVIELAAIDLNGNMIFNTQFSPIGIIEQGATNIHGLTNQSLSEKSKFKDKVKYIEIILKKPLLIYNFDYDQKALAETFKMNGLEPIHLYGDCVMKAYAHYINDWDDDRESYRWQKLPGGNHTALGDCIATLKVIEEMANCKLYE